MQVGEIKQIAFVMTGALVCATLGLVIWDPTQTDTQELYDVQQSAKTLSLTMPAHKKGLSAETQSLAQTPLFVMTTGPMAYKEKSFKLFGVSMTPRRRAALISIDGNEAQWFEVGQGSAEAKLIEVGTNGVRIETPVGIRDVHFGDNPSADTSTSSASSGG